MVASLLEFIPEPTLADTGLPQQWALFEHERERTGRAPPVIEARDVLADPRGMLTRLCAAVGLTFTPAMLSWPAGPHPQDGIWAKHWYDKVFQTTGFGTYRPKEVEVPVRLAPLLRECETIYRHLTQFTLKPP
jgi:hypothetical protein